ncbi:hypothetical protein [Rathayibacter sp. Leaf296]|uniref:hypothetical protein n=1 Tax=Rathayibacter sp. Leaf296 TaxID=1736327 RepID=UPI0007033915|nr:hypothetical protein [Rathayibacter sp. Leaf296]KQQ10439.1 hypothetical protein ASF46_05115 [Rathayibacter sp. Leaf296]
MSRLPAGPAVRLAEELLARAGCADSARPWVLRTRSGGHRSIDFAALERHVHELDLSEEAVARVALSLATGLPIDLRAALGYLTRDHAELVMTVVACVGGHDRTASRVRVSADRRSVETVPPLGSWAP